MIADRILKFLYDPDESQLVENVEEEEELCDEEENKEKQVADESDKKKNDRSEKGSKTIGGRPRRSTVGKSIVQFIWIVYT